MKSFISIVIYMDIITWISLWYNNLLVSHYRMEFEWIVKLKRKIPREACSGGLFYN